MKSMNVSEAKAKFSAVVEQVERGEEILLCRRNLPVAKIVPSRVIGEVLGHRTRIGWAKDSVRLHDDLTDPIIPEDNWDMLK